MGEGAAIFRALADPTRLRLAVLLAAQGETCVCQLAQGLAASGYRISRHLGVMRSAGIVEARREGTWMYYQLARPRQPLEVRLQECLRDCLADHRTVKADLKRLSRATCVK